MVHGVLLPQWLGGLDIRVQSRLDLIPRKIDSFDGVPSHLGHSTPRLVVLKTVLAGVGVAFLILPHWGLKFFIGA